ncbi:hypothetical protein [Sanyastnella coralliicola]|uniref:hypothetical protein n=1 Tax=Sanyastnella coralliicola TaxID=3069118 RepID=UPI0027B9E10B|nr:hypothetical protein [Longitalea sp. SCSIO 12813]
MKKLTLSILLALIVSVASATLPKVLFYGNVIAGDIGDIVAPTEKVDETFMNGVMVTIECEGEVIREYANRSTGFYSVILDSGKKYMVTFSKDGFISKRFEINTEAVVPLEKKSFKMYTDVTLFEKPDKGDFSAYEKQPVAKCKYNNTKQRLDWDMDYARMAFNHFVKTAKNVEATASVAEE